MSEENLIFSVDNENMTTSSDTPESNYNKFPSAVGVARSLGQKIKKKKTPTAKRILKTIFKYSFHIEDRSNKPPPTTKIG